MAEERWTIWVCPECGETVTESCDKPMLPGRGHYHDDPENPFHKRIFHPAQRVQVIPASILNDCIEELERREADSLKVAAETEVSPSFATAYRHRAAAFNKAANLLREKSGEEE